MSAAPSVVSSYSFYPADMLALANRLAELKAAGVKLRRPRFIRALVHLTTEAEMFAAAARLAAAYADREVRESDYIAARPEVEMSAADVEKLDRVKEELVRKKVFVTANRAFVIRAVLRWSPSGAALAPEMRKFMEQFPNKPRGRNKPRPAKPHG